MNESPEVGDQKTVAVPLFGSWRKAYLAVAVAFVLEVTFFYFISRFFS